MKTRITVKPETRLERHVKTWLNRQASNYDDDSVEAVLKDLEHGCSSGMVSHLIYFCDTVKFFARYRRDISALLAGLVADTGEPPDHLFANWDEADPLAQEDANRNLLAWFGFEEAARNLARREGIEA